MDASASDMIIRVAAPRRLAVTQAVAGSRLSYRNEKCIFDYFFALNIMMNHERIGFQEGIVFVTERLRKFEFCFLHFEIWEPLQKNHLVVFIRF